MAENTPSSSMAAKGKEPMASSEQDQNTNPKATPRKNIKIYAVELYFDPHFEVKTLDIIRSFEAHNLISIFPDKKAKWKPCIFLLKSKDVNPEELKNVIEEFASTHETTPIKFLTWSLVVRPRIRNASSVFLAAVPSMPLMKFHDEFCKMVQKKCVVDVKGSWAPLCPIGFDMPNDKLVKALNAAFGSNFLYEGFATSVGLAEFSDSRRTPLFSFQLKKSPEYIKKNLP